MARALRLSTGERRMAEDGANEMPIFYKIEIQPKFFIMKPYLFTFASPKFGTEPVKLLDNVPVTVCFIRQPLASRWPNLAHA